jgi:hypothetical protein
MNIHGVAHVSVEKRCLGSDDIQLDDIQLVDVKVLSDDGNEFVLTLFCSTNRDDIDVVVKGL